MYKKVLPAGLFLLSLVGIVAGYVLTNSIKYGFCYVNFQTNTFDVSCIDMFERIGNPIYYGMPALAIVFLALLFFPNAMKVWWKKFAIWFLPLAVLIFASYGPPSSGDLFSPNPVLVYEWVGIIYVVVSLCIIGWVYWGRVR